MTLVAILFLALSAKAEALPAEALSGGTPTDETALIHTRNSFSFFLAGNRTEEKNGYGGTHEALGLQVQRAFGGGSPWSWLLTLQADTLGRQQGFEVRRGAYMAGFSRQAGGFWLSGQLGILDTMLINEKERDEGGDTVNPWTGASVPKKGVVHDDNWGYLLSVRRPFVIGPLAQGGWGWSPYLAVAAPFSGQDDKAVATLGAAVEWYLE